MNLYNPRNCKGDFYFYTTNRVKECKDFYIKKSKHLWKTTSEDAYNFKTKFRGT